MPCGLNRAFEALDGLRREGDFGDEDDGVLAVGDGEFNRAQVNLGFPAAGDAVEEDRAGVLAAGGGADGVNRGGLFGGRFGGGGGDDLLAGPRVAGDLFFPDDKQAASGQGTQRAGGRGGIPEVGHRDGFPAGQGVENGGLARGAAVQGLDDGGFNGRGEAGGAADAGFVFLGTHGGRGHGAQDVLHRRQVVTGNPAGKLEEFWRKDGVAVEQSDDVLELDIVRQIGGGAVAHGHDGAGGRAVAERHADTLAGRETCGQRGGHAVVEHPVRRVVEQNRCHQFHAATMAQVRRVLNGILSWFMRCLSEWIVAKFSMTI